MDTQRQVRKMQINEMLETLFILAVLRTQGFWKGRKYFQDRVRIASTGELAKSRE